MGIPNLVLFFTRYLGDIVFVLAFDEKEARRVVYEQLQKEARHVVALHEGYYVEQLEAEARSYADGEIVVVYSSDQFLLLNFAMAIYQDFNEGTRIVPIEFREDELMPRPETVLRLGLDMDLQGLFFELEDRDSCRDDDRVPPADFDYDAMLDGVLLDMSSGVRMGDIFWPVGYPENDSSES